MKSESHPIPIGRREANFDRACDEALRTARAQYRGHLKSARYDKSTDFFMLEFDGYHYDGSRYEDPHQYKFTVWMERRDGSVEIEGEDEKH